MVCRHGLVSYGSQIIMWLRNSKSDYIAENINQTEYSKCENTEK